MYVFTGISLDLFHVFTKKKKVYRERQIECTVFVLFTWLYVISAVGDHCRM